MSSSTNNQQRTNMVVGTIAELRTDLYDVGLHDGDVSTVTAGTDGVVQPFILDRQSSETDDGVLVVETKSGEGRWIDLAYWLSSSQAAFARGANFATQVVLADEDVSFVDALGPLQRITSDGEGFTVERAGTYKYDFVVRGVGAAGGLFPIMFGVAVNGTTTDRNTFASDAHSAAAVSTCVGTGFLSLDAGDVVTLHNLTQQAGPAIDNVTLTEVVAPGTLSAANAVITLLRVGP